MPIIESFGPRSDAPSPIPGGGRSTSAWGPQGRVGVWSERLNNRHGRLPTIMLNLSISGYQNNRLAPAFLAFLGGQS